MFIFSNKDRFLFTILLLLVPVGLVGFSVLGGTTATAQLFAQNPVEMIPIARDAETNRSELRFVPPRLPAKSHEKRGGVFDTSSRDVNSRLRVLTADSALEQTVGQAVGQTAGSSAGPMFVPPIPLQQLPAPAVPVPPLSMPVDTQVRQPAIPKPLPLSVEQARIDALLQEGALLERERRWQDLLTLYEKALHTYRNNPVLLQRFRIARYHYDINRRYLDASFLNMLLSAGVVDNLVLFDEVTTKIQSNHIDSPGWTDLFHYGVQDLETALTEPLFFQKNGFEASPEKIARFRENLHAMIGPWKIGNREEMRNSVLHVAQLAQRELGLNPSATVLEFICGVANSLDPYTAFLTRNQLNDTYSTIDGNFVGLGVELKSDRRSLIIVRVISGSPAKEAGLADGDRILAVDGKPTQGLDTDRAADMLLGDIGTSVRLQVQSTGNEPRQVEVQRRRVRVPSIEDAKMLNDYLGYLKLTCFQATTASELRETLWKLHQKGMRCLVLDLRHNPGGLLPVSVDVANLFIEQGTIVSTRVHPQDTGTPYIATPGGTWRMPLVVLIDEESASASEILAGAIRDHGRGVIVGKRSFGKGTVQVVHRLQGTSKTGDIAGLKLTVEKFYSPSGISCSGIGVVPDILVEDAPPEMERYLVARPIDGQTGASLQPAPRIPSSAPTDPYMLKAVETARKMMSTAAAGAVLN